eukprot:6773872-Alexandrium_andersonii.AAC.1
MLPPSWATCWTGRPTTTSDSQNQCTTMPRVSWHVWATSRQHGWARSRLRSTPGFGWEAR